MICDVLLMREAARRGRRHQLGDEIEDIVEVKIVARIGEFRSFQRRSGIARRIAHPAAARDTSRSSCSRRARPWWLDPRCTERAPCCACFWRCRFVSATWISRPGFAFHATACCRRAAGHRAEVRSAPAGSGSAVRLDQPLQLPLALQLVETLVEQIGGTLGLRPIERDQVPEHVLAGQDDER